MVIRLFILILFFCLNGYSSALAEPEVSGIIYGDKPFAVVNGKLVKSGDEIEGYKVITIGKDFVNFKMGNETIRKKIEETAENNVNSKEATEEDKVKTEEEQFKDYLNRHPNMPFWQRYFEEARLRYFELLNKYWLKKQEITPSEEKRWWESKNDYDKRIMELRIENEHRIMERRAEEARRWWAAQNIIRVEQIKEAGGKGIGQESRFRQNREGQERRGLEGRIDERESKGREENRGKEIELEKKYSGQGTQCGKGPCLP